MRNELAEEFMPVLMSQRCLNRDAKRVRVRRKGKMKGKRGKRRVNMRSDQEKQTGETVRQASLSEQGD
jgi:hypothetical protein